MRAATAWVIVGGSVVLSASCGGGNAPRRAEPSRAPQPATSASAEVRPVSRPGRLWRRDVMAVLSRGLGDFLTRLEIEPFLLGGKFRGWRVVKLRQGDPLWNGIDLAPGDVVTAVNARPIERPEQALAVFQSLAIAKELRVTYERNGAPREIAYAIDDEVPAPGPAK
jgi:S1-C subfamily serine protease